MRFAFMQSSGESYAVDDTFTSVNLSRSCSRRSRASCALQQGPVDPDLAPCLRTGSSLEGAPREIRKAELALVGAFESYDRCRGAMVADDRPLLLATKWDLPGAQQDRAVSEVLRHTYADEVNAFLARHSTQPLALLLYRHATLLEKAHGSPSSSTSQR